MNNFTRVQILQSFSNLVDDKLDMDLFEYSFSNHIMQISLHKLEHQVYIFVIICFYCLD